MTKPRRVLPGTTYLITRRCSERRFFLRPDPAVTQIFEYLLGWLAKKHHIEIHAYVVMSNHYHLVLTDTKGRLPNFQRELNSLLARSINEFRRRSERSWDRDSFWDRKSYNAVELLEEADTIDKIAYTEANPTAARLVNRARQWDGATSAGMRYGRPRTIARPSSFFGKHAPKSAQLELTRPSGSHSLSNARFRELIDQEVSRREGEHMTRGKAMGMARVMKQDPNSGPASTEERGGMRPTFASKNNWRRIAAIRDFSEWLNQYREALASFVAGSRDVEFPPGTWWMCARLRCNRASL